LSFDAPLDLAPRASLGALRFLFFVHAVPLVFMVIALPPGPPLVLAAGAIGLSWLMLRRHPVLGYGSRALIRLTWHADGRWTVHDAGGATLHATLLGSSLVGTPALVLRFGLDTGGRRVRALFGDELDPVLWQRLRARLANAAG
jgi:hypothetical protein